MGLGERENLLQCGELERIREKWDGERWGLQKCFSPKEGGLVIFSFKEKGMKAETKLSKTF